MSRMGETIRKARLAAGMTEKALGKKCGLAESVVKDIEIKHLLKNALTEKINDRELYMKGIDVSYYYEGYSEYRVEDL